MNSFTFHAFLFFILILSILRLMAAIVFSSSSRQVKDMFNFSKRASRHSFIRVVKGSELLRKL